MANVRYSADGEQLVEIKFKFKIDTVAFAKRLGIEVPDDKMDGALTGSSEHEESDVHDCRVDAEDAGVTYSFADKKVETDYEDCRAKNPLTCRYHGVKAIANELDSFLKAQGVNADVNVDVLSLDTTGGKQEIQVQASIVAKQSEEKQVRAALKAFYALDGVTGDESNAEFNDDDNKYEDFFDVDMLDPKAVARWSANQNAASQAGTGNAPAPTSGDDGTKPADDAPAKAPAKKGKRTRKQTRKGMINPNDNPAPAEEPAAKEQATEPIAEQPTVIDDDFDPEAPTLFPGVAPKEPPKWTPPYDQTELDMLAKYAKRIGKTAERLDEAVAKEAATPGYLEQYLNKGNGDQSKPNAHLPSGLQKWKNGVDVNALRALADKDTDGQVKKLLEAAEKIDASEANGWKDTIGETRASLPFDPNKYVDPYAKERAEFESFKPSSESRDIALKSLSEIDSSSAKDAPKDAAKSARDAASELKELEDAYDELKDLDDKDILTKLGQDYYKANETYSAAIKECKNWLAKQCIAQDTIAEVIDAYKARGQEVPAELTNMQAVEDEVKDRGWAAVASYHGLNKNDKTLLENFRKNIKAYFAKCPTCSSYDIDDICQQIFDNETEYTKSHTNWSGVRTPGKTCKNNHRFHASNNSYVKTQNGVFGLNESPHTKSSKLQMHAYGTVVGLPFRDVTASYMYRGGKSCCTMCVNPKQVAIAFFGEYYSTADYFEYSNADPKNRDYTGSYVNNANPSMFGNSPSRVSSRAFTEDLSNLDFADLQSALGFGHQTGEAWMIGGIPENAILVVKEQKARGQISAARVKEFNKRGITVMDNRGKIVGEDCVPDDPDLVKLVWGSKGRPKKK